MFGKVVVLFVQFGQKVEKGVLLLIFEVMKMEYIIIVFVVGIVKVFCYVVGEQVSDGVVLVEFEGEV